MLAWASDDKDIGGDAIARKGLKWGKERNLLNQKFQNFDETIMYRNETKAKEKNDG